jgi:hypothetical protein
MMPGVSARSQAGYQRYGKGERIGLYGEGRSGFWRRCPLAICKASIMGSGPQCQ